MQHFENYIEKNFDFMNVNILERLALYEEDNTIEPLYQNLDEDAEDTYPVYEGLMYSYIFIPRHRYLREFIYKNAQDIYDKCGFDVYEQKDVGVFLGINGYGYDFYENHWKPFLKMLSNK